MLVPDPSPPAVEASRELADRLLRPAAEATDQAPVVPASHLAALAGAGLQGLVGPVEFGGQAAPAVVTRQVFETLAGACGVTFFVWVQHHAPVRLLAASPNADLRRRHLPALCRGKVLGGVAFAHLRRPGAPAVTARPVPGGYRVDGEAPWVTSWGLAGVYAVAATVRPGDGGTAAEQVLHFCLPGTATDEVRPSPPLALTAMNASATVRLRLSNLFVPHDDVISTAALDEWRRRDRLATALPNPAVFGIAAACLTHLGGGPDTEALGDELRRCRDHSYGLADATAGPSLDELVEARAWSLELAVRCALSLVVATGGRAMERFHPAQRLLREAAFFTIQAQAPAVRDATLRRLRRESR